MVEAREVLEGFSDGRPGLVWLWEGWLPAWLVLGEGTLVWISLMVGRSAWLVLMVGVTS